MSIISFTFCLRKMSFRICNYYLKISFPRVSWYESALFGFILNKYFRICDSILWIYTMMMVLENLDPNLLNLTSWLYFCHLSRTFATFVELEFSQAKPFFFLVPSLLHLKARSCRETKTLKGDLKNSKDKKKLFTKPNIKGFHIEFYS